MSDPQARLHEQIQAHAAQEEHLDGAMLMGWVTVAEWMGPDGNRWLSRFSWSSSGREPPPWTTAGYLHEALYSWPDPTPDPEEDE